MNKKVNTLLFIVGATLFNFIVTVICFFALLKLYASFLAGFIPEESRGWGFPLIFIAAIALSFIIYRLAMKLFLKKVEVERYFEPIFGNRKYR